MGAATIAQKITSVIINPTLALLFALGLLIFLWGVAEFIWQSDSEESRKVGQRHMIWGVVGMFIMLAALGIINIIVGTFNAVGF